MWFEPREYLLHMLAEADYLKANSEAVTRDAFLADPTLQRAFVRSLEIIGEAAKKLPPEFRDLHRNIDWSATSRMRDRLIHGYFSVDYELVWEVIQERIPTLRGGLRDILGSDAG